MSTELVPNLLYDGPVKLADSEAITGTQRGSSQQIFSYAAVSVAVISRQIAVYGPSPGDRLQQEEGDVGDGSVTGWDHVQRGSVARGPQT
jgi:hypothetical protein